MAFPRERGERWGDGNLISAPRRSICESARAKPDHSRLEPAAQRRAPGAGRGQGGCWTRRIPGGVLSPFAAEFRHFALLPTGSELLSAEAGQSGRLRGGSAIHGGFLAGFCQFAALKGKQ